MVTTNHTLKHSVHDVHISLRVSMVCLEIWLLVTLHCSFSITSKVKTFN